MFLTARVQDGSRTVPIWFLNQLYQSFSPCLRLGYLSQWQDASSRTEREDPANFHTYNEHLRTAEFCSEIPTEACCFGHLKIMLRRDSCLSLIW